MLSSEQTRVIDLKQLNKLWLEILINKRRFIFPYFYDNINHSYTKTMSSIQWLASCQMHFYSSKNDALDSVC